MKIKFYYDEVKFRIKESARTKKFIEKVIRNENLIPGDLNFIFTNDMFLREINREFLNHDYFTDVIAFNYNVFKKINGEIYISVGRIKQNALNYNVSFKEEIMRVMLHGVLHLCGYEDGIIEKKDQMSRKENDLLKSYFGEK